MALEHLRCGYCDQILDFKFYFILVDLNLNSYMWLQYRTAEVERLDKESESLRSSLGSAIRLLGNWTGFPSVVCRASHDLLCMWHQPFSTTINTLSPDVPEGTTA